jgi:hypothetical protein
VTVEATASTAMPATHALRTERTTPRRTRPEGTIKPAPTHVPTLLERAHHDMSFQERLILQRLRNTANFKSVTKVHEVDICD